MVDAEQRAAQVAAENATIKAEAQSLKEQMVHAQVGSILSTELIARNENYTKDWELQDCPKITARRKVRSTSYAGYP